MAKVLAAELPQAAPLPRIRWNRRPPDDLLRVGGEVVADGDR
jgi:hypothetical protein